MSMYVYYAVGQYYDQPPVLLESFGDRTAAYEFVGALNDMAMEGETFYVTMHYPGDIQQL